MAAEIVDQSIFQFDDAVEDVFCFNPARLTLARRRRGLNKTQLAVLTNLDTRAVTAYEAGEYRPSGSTLQRIAASLQFPKSFFVGETLHEPTPDSASFRAQSKMTAPQRDMALSQGAIALHLSSWLEARFELPEVNVPALDREQTPDVAADVVRREWGLGNAPISNMVHLLESKGVRVFSLSVKAKEVDAFSMWSGDVPFIFLNTQKTAEHSRFDAAHELGHLVLHRHAAPQGRVSEREADAFASAFLMPRASVLSHIPRFATVEELIKLKEIWLVSVAALAYRFHKLKVLSDWHYRSIYIELSKSGFTRREPRPAAHETSQILAKILAALKAEGLKRQDIAEELCISLSEFDDLLVGLGFGRISGKRLMSDPSLVAAKGPVRVK